MDRASVDVSPIVAAHIRSIAEKHGVRDVRVFGSRARGQARSTSDLDLLVRLEPGRGFRDFMDFCEEVEEVAGAKVDVITEDGLSPILRSRVLAEAVPL